MITSFLDTTIRKNAMRGRERKSPLTYKEALEEARMVMYEAGYSGPTNLTSWEPYSGNLAGRESAEKKALEKRISQLEKQLQEARQSSGRRASHEQLRDGGPLQQQGQVLQPDDPR